MSSLKMNGVVPISASFRRFRGKSVDAFAENIGRLRVCRIGSSVIDPSKEKESIGRFRVCRIGSSVIEPSKDKEC